MIPKVSGYAKGFNDTKCVSFFIKNDVLLEKYSKIWNKVSNTVKEGFDSKPVFSRKYLKTKTKSSENKVSTSFHDDGIPKEGAHFNFISIILIDPVFKIDRNYYP